MHRGRLVVAGAAVLPVFYVAVYLAAFWNPLGHLDQLPVALVVEDAGARTASGPLNAGAALAATLERQHTFAWHVTAAGPATAGLASGRWDAELLIPAAFSADLASATSAHPRPATLQVRVDAADNYLAARFAGTVFSAIRSAAAAQFTSRLLASILVRVSAARGGAARAAAGAGLLA
ncbi:MAG: YhgE/Pip domain-containing protein, partial [Mycobacteriales bacterium]